MRRIFILTTLVIMSSIASERLMAQSAEVEQLMLNVEKLTQFKQILTDMKKGYKMLEGGYNQVRDVSKGNFSLHKTFLDGLMQISPTVRKYRRIADIINDQIVITKTYKTAFDKFKRDKNFNEKELVYLGDVYANLLKLSLRNLNELSLVITAGQARMTDEERLAAIDKIYVEMEDKIQFLRYFNNQTTVLSLQRAKEQNDASSITNMHGISK